MDITPKTAISQILIAILKELKSIQSGGGALTDDQLRAQPVPVAGPLTDTQLRASAVPVSGPLTDAELRASAVPVSGPLTDAELRASAVPVSGPLTDAQLRASAVPVSGPLTDAELRASAVPVSGPLTDTQLRAAAVPVTVPRTNTVTILAVETSNPGTGWATFASQPCSALDIVNSTGVDIRYRRGGAGAYMVVPNNSSRLVIGITNANEISVQRDDQNNTQVTVRAEAIS